MSWMAWGISAFAIAGGMSTAWFRQSFIGVHLRLLSRWQDGCIVQNSQCMCFALQDPLPASSTTDAPPATMHTTHTSTATGGGPTLDPAADGAGAAGRMGGAAVPPEEGQNRSAGTAIKEAFTGAPWEARHERTMEALTHAKTAHVKAVQAQAELQAAQKARQDAELAERHRLEVGGLPTLGIGCVPSSGFAEHCMQDFVL